MIWAVATAFNTRNSTDIHRIYSIDGSEETKTLATFILLMVGGFIVLFFLVRAM